MRTRTVAALLAIAVLVSLGAVTQSADAAPSTDFNERVVISSANPQPNDNAGIDYYSHTGIWLKFTFDGDRTPSDSTTWLNVGQQPSSSGLTGTNSATFAAAGQGTNSADSFWFQYKVTNV